MPIIFTDGRKGLTLISKEYEGSYYLMHHGVPGQKKGKRRWQYEDGTYTPEGRIHYGIGEGNKKPSKLVVTKNEYKDILNSSLQYFLCN